MNNNDDSSNNLSRFKEKLNISNKIISSKKKSNLTPTPLTQRIKGKKKL